MPFYYKNLTSHPLPTLIDSLIHLRYHNILVGENTEVGGRGEGGNGKEINETKYSDLTRKSGACYFRTWWWLSF